MILNICYLGAIFLYNADEILRSLQISVAGTNYMKNIIYVSPQFKDNFTWINEHSSAQCICVFAVTAQKLYFPKLHNFVQTSGLVRENLILLPQYIEFGNNDLILTGGVFRRHQVSILLELQ